jgi:hypothetical protein
LGQKQRRAEKLNNEIMSGALFKDMVPGHDQLTTRVQHFAEATNLVFTPYYHDLALWIVSDPDVEDGITRSVHTQCSLQDGLIYLTLNSIIKVCSSNPPSRKIPRAALSESMLLRDLTRQGRLNRQQLNILLTRAWEEATSLQSDPSKIQLIETLTPAMR